MIVAPMPKYGPLACKGCGELKDLEKLSDDPTGIKILCNVCSKETKYERESTD
jgi:hypothetical protein